MAEQRCDAVILGRVSGEVFALCGELEGHDGLHESGAFAWRGATPARVGPIGMAHPLPGESRLDIAREMGEVTMLDANSDEEPR